jgi:hypothetical protein
MLRRRLMELAHALVTLTCVLPLFRATEATTARSEGGANMHMPVPVGCWFAPAVRGSQ